MLNYNNLSGKMVTEMCMRQRGKIVIITGMHRSGTSLTTSLLESSGLNIGKRLMGASPGNIKGHFENLDFVGFHQKVLSSQGISQEGWSLENNIQVQEQYVNQAKLMVRENAVLGNWGWKDPRTTLFLNFWADLLPQANFLFVYRSPWEVVDSLYRRGDEIFYSNPNFALKIWINYNKSILDFYNKFSERCVLLDIKNVVKSPIVLSKLVNQKLDVTLDNPNRDISDRSLLNGQVSNSHRPKLMEYFFPEAVDLYYELEAKSDIKSCNHLGFETSCHPTRFIDWVFQDWLDIRKIERNSNLELQHYQCQLEKIQVESRDYQCQLEKIQVESRDYQCRLEKTQVESRDYQCRLEKTQAELQHYQCHLEKTQAELQHYQCHLEKIQAELVRSQVMIAAMESSKFWKLRTIWCHIKKSVFKVFGSFAPFMVKPSE